MKKDEDLMRPSVVIPSASPRVCPDCGTTHVKGERFCIIDGQTLVPLDPQTEPAASPQIGRVIAERCELLQPLGKGGMSEVFLGFHRTLMCDVAVKLVNCEGHSDRSLIIKRFLRETLAVARLEHDNIVRILDFGIDGSEPFLMMELLQGVSLHRHLDAADARQLPLPDVIDILIQVLDALEHAHSHNVVHRDIKLENIMLIEHEENRRWIKLLDFGIAQLLDLVPDTPMFDLVGTPEYMAPELWSSARDVTPAVDLYACGILAHELLLGEPPFVTNGPSLAPLLLAHMHQPPPPLRPRREDIPEALEQLVLALLRKERSERPSAAEAAKALRVLRDQSPPRPERHFFIEADETMPGLPVAQSGAATVAMLSRIKTTAIAPFRLHQIEELDGEIDVLYGRVRERIDDVVAAAPRWPPSLQKLLASMKDMEEEEDALGEQLALLCHRGRGNQQQVAQRQQRLRQEMVLLAEQRNQCSDPRETRELTLAMDQRSREFATAAAALDSDLLAVTERTRELRQRQKDAARRVLVSLVHALLAQTAPPGLTLAFRELRTLVTALEAKLAELFVSLESLRRRV